MILMASIQSWGLDLLIDGVILLRLDGLEKKTSFCLTGTDTFENVLKSVLFVAHSPPETNSESYLVMIWAKRHEKGSPPYWHIECPLSKPNQMTFPGLIVTPWPTNVHPKFTRSNYPNVGIFPRGCPFKSNLEANPREVQQLGLGACLEFKSFIWKSQGELIPGHTINLSKDGFVRLHLRVPEDITIENNIFCQNIQYWPHVELFALERIYLPRPLEKEHSSILFTRDIGTEAEALTTGYIKNQSQNTVLEEMIITRKEIISSSIEKKQKKGILNQIIFGSGNILLSTFRWVIYSILLKPKIF